MGESNLEKHFLEWTESWDHLSYMANGVISSRQTCVLCSCRCGEYRKPFIACRLVRLLGGIAFQLAMDKICFLSPLNSTLVNISSNVFNPHIQNDTLLAYGHGS